jgi:predicted RNA-binding Zn-ribbon protein involved in translation (DUF1610 family)
MSILDNAKDSIIMGLEDYSSPEPKRMISCTRNLFAGILLLFKQKLVSLSAPDTDEALIKQKVLPRVAKGGEVKWIGQGRKTVDVQQIRERFEALDISVNWERVDAINRFRNDIEHYYTQLSDGAINALLSNCFLVIRDFLWQHLGIDPKEFLGDKAWSTLLSVSEVYEKEKQECVAIIESIKWASDSLENALVSFECPDCGSGLISLRDPQPEQEANEFYCRSCDASWDFETTAEGAIKAYFSWDNYLSDTDGGEPVTITCPECSLDTYIISEECCAVCGESAEHECQRCGTRIIPEEIDGSGYCAWCSHMMSKDD